MRAANSRFLTNAFSSNVLKAIASKPAATLTVAASLMLSSGCTLCAPGYLCDYAGVGGKWQRSDPENGRVGSILSDPNSFVSANPNAAPVVSEAEVTYPDGPSGESILEPGMEISTSDEGVVILGDDW